MPAWARSLPPPQPLIPAQLPVPALAFVCGFVQSSAALLVRSVLVCAEAKQRSDAVGPPSPYSHNKWRFAVTSAADVLFWEFELCPCFVQHHYCLEVSVVSRHAQRRLPVRGCRVGAGALLEQTLQIINLPLRGGLVQLLHEPARVGHLPPLPSRELASSFCLPALSNYLNFQRAQPAACAPPPPPPPPKPRRAPILPPGPLGLLAKLSRPQHRPSRPQRRGVGACRCGGGLTRDEGAPSLSISWLDPERGQRGCEGGTRRRSSCAYLLLVPVHI
eukprot:COSAG04_NODE_196_length_20686_cov_2.719823_2_plen_275_part_00